jgi:hypothetical protein
VTLSNYFESERRFVFVQQPFGSKYDSRCIGHSLLLSSPIRAVK